MHNKLIDANVILRFLVENPQTIPTPFKGVFTFFPKVEKGEIKTFLSDLVLFECYFVLTKYYEISQKETVEKLTKLISFKGIIMQDKTLILSCLDILTSKKIDLVDAYLIAGCKKNNCDEVYSFDNDLKKCGLKLLTVD
ncbi:MAG: PilT protein [uncultured bacterium]|nr:MAG: PilT protein [uncultured bacterium]